MAKYSYKLKKQVVNDYLNGEGGYLYLHKKYNIPGNSQVMRWVKSYNTFGDEGLQRSRANKSYSFEYKLHVVQLYLTNEISYVDLALKEMINNPCLVVRWVNDYRRAGPSALRPKKKGRKPSMNTDIIKSSIRETNVEVSKLQELEDENLRLRIENAYLKELRRLRLQDEQLLKERQESYIASEDHLN